MFVHPTVLPAYGRDYKSKAAALADWEAGKDFIIATSGQYCSINDDFPQVSIRYAKKTKQVVWIQPKKEQA